MHWYDPVPSASPRRFIVGAMDLKDLDAAILRRGKPVTTWDPTIWYRPDAPEDDGEPADALLCYPLNPLFSPRLQAALIQAGIRDLQFLPINLFHFTGELIDGFAFANVLRRVAALDRDRSAFVRAAGILPNAGDRILMLTRPVLRRAALADADIIRLDDYPVSIFVSERFRHVFEQGQFTGYAFHEVEVL